ncbi:integral membrane protein [Leucobacter sp. 7(1)]|uniref:hypothetical protein n=1 Tax=Leucobacter sp. 7(1) TaxID=1255613 RepID=UPI00097EFCF5|nr:hypothetical protein [Leucobacter sp. 7(1)]SJN12908.1 integral membrane protein [Leucobacter sp. 7(1)]
MSAVWLLIRPGRGSGSVFALQLIAAVLTTVLTFAVAMLARALWRVPSSEIAYQVLAVAIVLVLFVPLFTLGTATARLAARSRDERLATLRLLGATAARVRRMAVAEVTATAALGVLAGTGLSALLPLALGPLPLRGAPMMAEALWLPWWAWAALPPLLGAVAGGSAFLGLRQVILSPLGVRTRPEAPRLSWGRVAVAGAVVAAAVLVMQFMSPGWGLIVIVGALGLVVLAVMAVFAAVGPFAAALRARRLARRAADAPQLIAARGVQDDPRTAWRGVSALALATFVAIPAGSLLGYLDTIVRSQSREIMTPDQLFLFADARTYLLALVALAFLVVACQVALTQAAEVFERRELTQALDHIGMPRRALGRARALRVMIPARLAVIGSALAAAALAFPLVGIALAVAPWFLVATAAVLGLGLVLVRAGVSATSPLLRHELAAPDRGK